jgi:hypothetical protein
MFSLRKTYRKDSLSLSNPTTSILLKRFTCPPYQSIPKLEQGNPEGSASTQKLQKLFFQNKKVERETWLQCHCIVHAHLRGEILTLAGAPLDL